VLLRECQKWIDQLVELHLLETDPSAIGSKPSGVPNMKSCRETLVAERFVLPHRCLGWYVWCRLKLSQVCADKGILVGALWGKTLRVCS